MKRFSPLLLLAAVFGLASPQLQAKGAATAQTTQAQLTLEFDGKRYLHRYSKNGQHEFTPVGQEDLQRWQEMITLLPNPDIRGERTHQWAEAMAAGYKERGLLIHADQPPGGEYRMLGVLSAPGLVEVNFVRVMPQEEGALAFLVQRRFYGDDIPQMADWVKDNTPRISELLVSWQPPSSAALAALPESP